MSWSAEQYLAFEDERTRPVRDLVNAIPAVDARRVVDLGCGPGNSTEVLARRFPRAEVRGIDSSDDMIAAARKRLPALRFEAAEISTWRDAGPFDVILANAVLHWVPQHERLFPALLGKLSPGGALAIQMPDNLETPAHVLMRATALEGAWASKLAGAAAVRITLPDAAGYLQLLEGSCSRADVWRTTYYHRLAGGAPAIVEWFKGSGLRPFLKPLSDAERAVYLERYGAAVASAYPASADGSVLLPFPRLFIVALR